MSQFKLSLKRGRLVNIQYSVMLENFYYVLWLPLFRTVILEATLRPQCKLCKLHSAVHLLWIRH